MKKNTTTSQDFFPDEANKSEKVRELKHQAARLRWGLQRAAQRLSEILEILEPVVQDGEAHDVQGYIVPQRGNVPITFLIALKLDQCGASLPTDTHRLSQSLPPFPSHPDRNQKSEVRD